MSDVSVVEESSPGAAPVEGTPPSEEPVSPPGVAAEAESPPALAPDGGTPTLAEGGGEEDVAPESPANWPSNWREIMSGGDAKALGKLNRYASPANVWKALAATGQKISSGELLRSKPDGEDETALNEWRAQAGIPEKPEGYLEKLPDGLVIGEEDKPAIETFIADMHAADAPPNMVHTALGWYYAHQENQAAAQAEKDSNGRATNEDELRSEWGPEYRANLNGVHALLATHGDKDLTDRLFGARFADGSPLGDDPALLKLFAGINRELNPFGTVTPNDGQTSMQTITSRLAELTTEMTDTKGREAGGYWNSEAKQQEYRDLLDMQEKQKSRIAVPGGQPSEQG